MYICGRFWVVFCLTFGLVLSRFCLILFLFLTQNHFLTCFLSVNSFMNLKKSSLFMRHKEKKGANKSCAELKREWESIFHQTCRSHFSHPIYRILNFTPACTLNNWAKEPISSENCKTDTIPSRTQNLAKLTQKWVKKFHLRHKQRQKWLQNQA